MMRHTADKGDMIDAAREAEIEAQKRLDKGLCSKCGDEPKLPSSDYCEGCTRNVHHCAKKNCRAEGEIHTPYRNSSWCRDHALREYRNIALEYLEMKDKIEFFEAWLESSDYDMSKNPRDMTDSESYIYSIYVGEYHYLKSDVKGWRESLKEVSEELEGLFDRNYEEVPSWMTE